MVPFERFFLGLMGGEVNEQATADNHTAYTGHVTRTTKEH